MRLQRSWCRRLLHPRTPTLPTVPHVDPPPASLPTANPLPHETVPETTGKSAGADAGVPQPGFRLFQARQDGGVAAPWEAYLDSAGGIRERGSGPLLHRHCRREHGRPSRE